MAVVGFVVGLFHDLSMAGRLFLFLGVVRLGVCVSSVMRLVIVPAGGLVFLRCVAATG